MPKIDFSDVGDVADFTPIPDGEYTCVLVDIEEDMTSKGFDMWKLRWRVEDGDYAGRLLFDNMVFSPKAMPRVKLVCDCCGVDVDGEVNLEPSMLLDKRAGVATYQDEYPDDKGQQKVRNNIRYDGYSFPQVTEGSTPF